MTSSGLSIIDLLKASKLQSLPGDDLFTLFRVRFSLTRIGGEDLVDCATMSRRPVDIAARAARGLARRDRLEGFRRDTFALPREAAREKARELFRRFPKAAYMTEIESWRELSDGRIEFTMRRLPSAD
jgi:hypothetical protein